MSVAHCILCRYMAYCWLSNKDLSKKSNNTFSYLIECMSTGIIQSYLCQVYTQQNISEVLVSCRRRKAASTVRKNSLIVWYHLHILARYIVRCNYFAVWSSWRQAMPVQESQSVSQSVSQKKIDKIAGSYISCFYSILALECFCVLLLQIWHVCH